MMIGEYNNNNNTVIFFEAEMITMAKDWTIESIVINGKTFDRQKISDHFDNGFTYFVFNSKYGFFPNKEDIEEIKNNLRELFEK